MNSDNQHAEVLIIGGGTGGITVASQLLQQQSPPRITVIEPAAHHDYQPLWTLVGGGVFPREESRRSMSDVMPDSVEWIRERVQGFEPESNQVVLESGKRVTYEMLVVAAGIQLDWGRIKGMEAVGTRGICSNYSYETVPYTWECIRNFTGGKAVFTFPSTPIKCAGAPQKIMYLAEESFRRHGCRARSEVRKVILAEFGYDGQIMETFPFDQAQERYSMYALKAYGLPQMYWHGMLHGRI